MSGVALQPTNIPTVGEVRAVYERIRCRATAIENTHSILGIAGALFAAELTWETLTTPSISNLYALGGLLSGLAVYECSRRVLHDNPLPKWIDEEVRACDDEPVYESTAGRIKGMLSMKTTHLIYSGPSLCKKYISDERPWDHCRPVFVATLMTALVVWFVRGSISDEPQGKEELAKEILPGALKGFALFEAVVCPSCCLVAFRRGREEEFFRLQVITLHRDEEDTA